MNRTSFGGPRVPKLRLALVGAVAAGVVGVVSLPTAQAVEGGDATCDALDVALLGEFADTVVVAVSGGTDDVVAPNPDNGTNTGGGSGTVAVPGDNGSVGIDLLTCEATRAPEFLSANAEIAGGNVTLAGTEVVTLGAITSEVVCPAAGTGNPTASAAASLTVGGEVISLDTDVGDVVGEGNVDFAIAGVLDGVLTVTAEASAAADADSANATGLQITVVFSGALLGQSVVLNFGTVTLAETSCTVGAPDSGPPTTTPATTAPSTTAPSTTVPPAMVPPATAPPAASPSGGVLPATR